MSRLLPLLNKQSLTLIVELPENSLELAKAAHEGGCHALILKDQKVQAREIIESVKVPVGASIGREGLTEAGLKELQKTGFDFIDIDLGSIPEWLLKAEGIGKIATLDPDYSAHDLTALAQRSINAVDAAVIAKEEAGKDLTVGDLQHYITIALSTGLPVLVPTQKLVRVSEVPIIWDTGAKGIILTATVAGNTPQSIRSVTKEFREAMEALKAG